MSPQDKQSSANMSRAATFFLRLTLLNLILTYATTHASLAPVLPVPLPTSSFDSQSVPFNMQSVPFTTQSIPLHVKNPCNNVWAPQPNLTSQVSSTASRSWDTSVSVLNFQSYRLTNMPLGVDQDLVRCRECGWCII